MSIKRSAESTWKGNLKAGTGKISSASGVLSDTPFGFNTRFENEQGTNPEELVAAAHASCFSMAFANFLSEKGHEPNSIHTKATLSLNPKELKVTAMHLETTGDVEGLNAEQFSQLATEAEAGCPISNLLRNGLEITLDAKLA